MVFYVLWFDWIERYGEEIIERSLIGGKPWPYERSQVQSTQAHKYIYYINGLLDKTLLCSWIEKIVFSYTSSHPDTPKPQITYICNAILKKCLM